MATSSIPRDVLEKVLSRQIDPKNFEQRTRLVRLFLQAERFNDAEAQMQGILRDFPNKQDLASLVGELRQRDARRIIDEIVLRRKVGQPQLARRLLENFPSDDVAGETMQKVREMIADFDKLREEGVELLAQLKALVDDIKDTSLQLRARAVYDEIVAEISLNTADRMAAYLRLAKDEKLSGEDKFSLAASGWIVGSNEAINQFARFALDVRSSQLGAKVLERPGEKQSQRRAQGDQEPGSRHAANGGPDHREHETAAFRQDPDGRKQDRLLRTFGPRLGQGTAGDVLRANTGRIRPVSRPIRPSSR